MTNVRLLGSSGSIAVAPKAADRSACEGRAVGFTAEDLIVAINQGGRARAEIKRDGRFQVAGGAVIVELTGTVETKGGPRKVSLGELCVRTLPSYEAKPLHVLIGRRERMPAEGVIWDITIDGSEVIRVGRQTGLHTTMQKLRTVLSRRRVIL